MKAASSTLLTDELGVSRNTVLAAIDQLAAEGYVATRTGSGTFVAQLAPETPAPPSRPAGPTRAPGPAAALSERGRALAAAALPRSLAGGAFMPGLADHREFPFALWSRMLAKAWRPPPAALVQPGAASDGHSSPPPPPPPPLHPPRAAPH